MVGRRKNAINSNNYRERAELEAARFEREAAAGSDANALLNRARGIGNMYAEFGDIVGARPWYARALEIARRQRHGPSQTTVYMLWRMGDQEVLEKECRALIANRSGRAEELRPQLVAANEERRYKLIRLLALVYHDLAAAHFYLREFREASDMAARAEVEVPFAPEQGIVRALTDALDKRDPVAYGKALASMRGRVFEWPTFASDTSVDLYRLSIALGKECFGSIASDLQEELGDRG